jgi:hypothetical protein
MNFTKEKRQAVIDEYLAETGQNLFQAPAFVDWLAQKPEHEAYSWFFGMSNDKAAREHRIHLARRMASGLRIVVRYSEAKPSVVHMKVREYPAYVSPVTQRHNGGGYVRFDPADADAVAELRSQGMTALRAWLVRYRHVFSETECQAIEQIAAADAVRVAASA